MLPKLASQSVVLSTEVDSIPKQSEFHLGIVIPLKSRATSRDWTITCERLEATLQSLRGQTSQAYSVVLSGHEIPDSCEPFIRSGWLSQVRVNHPLPDLGRPTEPERQAEITRDKNAKIVAGVQALLPQEPSHWFALDADDWVDRHLVETVSRLPRDHGAILRVGYQIHVPTHRYRVRRKLDRLCGSTSILPAQCVSDLLDSDLKSSPPIPWCRYSHHEMQNYFQIELENRFVSIQEPLIAYLVGHGDNASDGYHRWLTTFRAFESIKSRLFGSDAGKLLTSRFSQGL